MKKAEKILMSAEEKQALLKMAESLGCVARTGPSAGKPSFRIMLQQMAEGRFIMYDKLKPRKKKEWAKKKKSAIPGAPPWWKPFYGNAMGIEYAMEKSGMTHDELVAAGWRVEINESLKHPTVVVGKPEWPAPIVKTRPHWWWKPDRGEMRADELARLGVDLGELERAGFVVLEGEIVLPPEGWDAWA